jgi:hypothetical protein
MTATDSNYANRYATDGLCHNPQIGTYRHECRKLATWLGTDKNGWSCGFCDDCKAHGHDARHMVSWRKITVSTYANVRTALIAANAEAFDAAEPDHDDRKIIDTVSAIVVNYPDPAAQLRAYAQILGEAADALDARTAPSPQSPISPDNMFGRTVFAIIETEDIEIKGVHFISSRESANAAFDDICKENSIVDADPEDLKLEVPGTLRLAGDDAYAAHLVEIETRITANKAITASTRP